MSKPLNRYLIGFLVFGLISPCYALEPVPRKWTHIPIDTNIIGAAYVRIESDIFSDPTLILQDVEMEKDIYLNSSNIYRTLRKEGITIRKPIDCMIAAVALHNNIPLLHNDKDFYPIETKFGLFAY